jgi:hypothetical protein
MSPLSAIRVQSSARKKSELCPLNSELFKRMGLTPELALLERAWDAEMGSWGTMARLAAIDKGSLVVEVTSSPAMQEISLRRRELVRRLNRFFPSPVVRHLTVRMAQEES